MLPSWLNSTTFSSQPPLSLRKKHLNWQKTKVQSLSDLDVRPMNFSIDGEAVECVKSFLYLGILTHESGYSTPETSKRLGLAGSAFGSLRTNICDSRFALSIKVRLFRTYVFPVLLYGAETWCITKEGPTSVGRF